MRNIESKYIKRAEYNKLLEKVSEIEKSSKKPLRTNIQNGNFAITKEDSTRIKSGFGERDQTWDIKYKEPFSSIPNVHCGISGIQADKGTKIWSEVKEVTKVGFKIRIGTWDGTKIQTLNIDWLAYVEEK